MGAIYLEGPTGQTSRMIRITDDTIKAAYIMLSSMSPFKRWKLPPLKSITFKATDEKDAYGTYLPEHIITISRAKNGHLDTLLRTTAHEMCHMVRYMRGNGDWDAHDDVFAEMTATVAARMGWDPKEL
jgi:hypothetical protein